MRRAARVDANHGEIIDAFRAFGFSVADTSRLGGGFPDCVIARNKKTALVEIKDGKKSASKRKLTTDEAQFLAGWRGRYFVAESLKDVEFINQEWVRL